MTRFIEWILHWYWFGFKYFKSHCLQTVNTRVVRFVSVVLPDNRLLGKTMIPSLTSLVNFFFWHNCDVGKGPRQWFALLKGHSTTSATVHAEADCYIYV